MDTPQGKLAVVAPKFVYGPNHPYARDSGTPDSLAKITTTDMKALYRRWFRPDDATLFIVGDTTLGEIMPKLEKALGNWRGDGPMPVKAPLPPMAKPNGPRIVLIDQPDAKSSIIGVSGPGPVRSAADFDADQVVTQMFGGNFLSRLNMNLREDKHWSYGAKAGLDESNLLGRFQAGAIVQTDKTADAMKEIDRELHDIITTRPPTGDEVTMAKNGMLLGLSSTLGTQAGEMHYYTQAYEYGLSPEYWNGYVGRISGISTAAVDAAAKKLVDPSQMTWFVAGDLSKVEADVRKLGIGEVIVVDAEGKRIR
jgi:zinc protease